MSRVRYVDFANAYAWRCPDCGLRNLVDQYCRQLDDADGPAAASAVVPGDGFTLIGAFEIGPVITTVHCLGCEARFEQRPGPNVSEE